MKQIAALVLLLLSAGCAKVNDAGMQLFSSSATAVVLLNETLLNGTLVFFTNRTGRLQLAAGLAGDLQCAGPLRYTATENGVIQLGCSDGTTVALTFTALGETGGFGQGSLTAGKASLAYGMPAAQAAAYLKPPAGKRLVVGPLGLELQPL